MTRSGFQINRTTGCDGCIGLRSWECQKHDAGFTPTLVMLEGQVVVRLIKFVEKTPPAERGARKIQ